MKWLESITTILKAITWPVVATLALILLCRPVARLIGRIKTFTIKEGVVTVELFAERLKKLVGKVEEQAKKAARKGKKTSIPKGVTAELEFSAGMPSRVSEEGQLLRLAAESPRSAIAEAWELVESSVDRGDAAQEPPENKGLPPSLTEPVPPVQSNGVLD